MSVAQPEALPAALPVRSLRLLPAPSSEPPYDDELPGATPLHLVRPEPRAGIALLAPAALLPAATPAAPPAHGGAPFARSVPAAAPLSPVLVPVPLPADEDADDDAPVLSPLGELPPVRPFATAMVQRLIEVLAGLRPLSQLQGDTSFELFTRLEQQVPHRIRTDGRRPRPGDVRSVHVQTSDDGVAEGCATVRRGGRMTALAFRLEGRAGSWRCTELVGV